MPTFLKPGILDIVDIMLVAWLVYRLLLLIRGTRAARMVLGITVLLLISMAAQILNLKGLSWIIDGVRVAWVLIVAIIFQPEIRRALTQLGQNPVIRNLLRVEYPKAIDEVTEAASLLSARGEGALIVLERNTGLKTWESTGTPVSAEVTAQLLATLFTPGSPLHDGAVILRGERIAAASCILPLAVRLQKTKTMGTRHLAALGISEETDAVAVVVSEETHQISLAVDGTLYRDLKRDALRTKLLELFEER